jgi:hypothetical protein
VCSNFILKDFPVMLYFYFLFFQKMLGVADPFWIPTPTFIIEPEKNVRIKAGHLQQTPDFFIFPLVFFRTFRISRTYRNRIRIHSRSRNHTHSGDAVPTRR